MPSANPYAKYLDGRPALAIMATTAKEVEALLTALGAEKAKSAPAPGKWSAHQIVAHLADCELAFAFRLRQAAAEESPAIQLFDQDKWATGYDAYTLEEAIAGFAALRAWDLAFLRSALPAAAGRKLLHPVRGEITFAELLEMIAGHDLNHIDQLRRIAGQ